ncbi:hypothetical protein SDRG_08053 [Saprolegnia diclina VS20]|uniref:Uncharacterized protein n=1 Tax=Saprolegnia diclina (strain VS20) TaxID=1156394 RepID=T0QKF9_SAPDV|nr:hypothetical protein SDRG_08053 [Saprolegnia diclina VS20]EQC34280.1 hypothetical protein SDRG_08053 [Saprolegnia diclina VS20]|eukprot:XP_008612142.1 hypothetical protein SDRG_08053 [Saprolegnia diclina VS20]
MAKPEHAETETELLGRYERRLVEKYRFALVDIIDDLCSLLNLFRVANGELDVLEPLAAKKLAQLCPFLRNARDKIALLTQATPLFLGYDDIMSYSKLLEIEIKALDPRPQPWNALRVYDKEFQEHFAVRIDKLTALYLKLAAHIPTLRQDMETHGSVLRILTRKRNDLVTLLRESMATTHLPANAKKHKSELKQWYQRSLAKYKTALQATPLKLEKQIQFEIRSFTESLNGLLAPHAEIAKTLRVANASVLNDAGRFSDADLGAILSSREAILRFEEAPGEFCALVSTSIETFLAQLQLFEAACREDLFAVLATPLKLGFTPEKAVDSEMFVAIGQDLQARMKELTSLRHSIKYQTVVAHCKEARYEVSVCYQQWQQASNAPSKDASKDDAMARVRRQIQSLVVADGLVCA